MSKLRESLWKISDVQIAQIDDKRMIWILDQSINERTCGLTPKNVSFSRYWCKPIIQLIDIVINNTCKVLTMLGERNCGARVIDE